MACTCLLDDEAKAQLRVSKAIEREMEQWKKEASKEFKLLLLGTGEAGKSTFIKQMRIIHGQGYSDKDRAEFKVQVYRNIYMGMQILIDAMDHLKISYSNPESKQLSALVNTIDRDTVSDLPANQYNALKRLWSDKGVQSCFDRRREFQISDSAKYYFDNIDRISEANYIPTIDDVLRVRVPTTGIIEYTFQMRKDVVFRMLDVGGQRSERRKWIHCFDDVKAIIFLTAINEYDQVLFEDENQNRMRESLALFELINNYPWFKESSVILFLNKTDLFYEKITKSKLADHFPAFQGPPGDIDSAREFILAMFMSVNPDPDNRRIFAHFTQATDTENIKRVFNDVREHVLEQNLKDYNLMWNLPVYPCMHNNYKPLCPSNLVKRS